MKFSCFEPSPALQPFIKCFWTLESELGELEGTTYRLIPDGYCELMFHRKSAWQMAINGQNDKISHSSFFIGQFSRYLDLTIPEQLSVFCIKFHPWAAAGFLGFPIHEITDHILPIDELPGHKYQQLASLIFNAPTTGAALQAAELFFKQKLPAFNNESFVTPAAKIILQSKGQLKIEELMNKVFISQRRFEQRFKEQVGVSAKYFSRITRISNATGKLRDMPNVSLKDIAYDYGFYDPAHFSREFKNFTDFTASEFKKRIKPSGMLLNFNVS